MTHSDLGRLTLLVKTFTNSGGSKYFRRSADLGLILWLTATFEVVLHSVSCPALEAPEGMFVRLYCQLANADGHDRTHTLGIIISVVRWCVNAWWQRVSFGAILVDTFKGSAQEEEKYTVMQMSVLVPLLIFSFTAYHSWALTEALMELRWSSVLFLKHDWVDSWSKLRLAWDLKVKGAPWNFKISNVSYCC